MEGWWSMWLMTDFGFFSIVAKPGQADRGDLTVRARAYGDLVRLRDRFLPTLGPIATGTGTDYRYRAVAPAADVARAAARAVAAIDYGNFKGAVAARQGHGRSAVYGKVWTALHGVADDGPPAMPTATALPPKPPGKAASFGGVVFDRDGRVLLRKTVGDFGGVRWTFPKGRPAGGEPPATTAQREAREEGGVDAQVCGPIPMWYEGQVTWSLYFVMDLAADHRDADPAETAAVRWATPDAARRLIAESAPAGRARDHAVLDAAVARRGRPGRF
jgi:8-oxo-dGTP pyrophosphatase MutT (NUDIX family)